MKHTFLQRLKYLFNMSSLEIPVKIVEVEKASPTLPNLPDGWYMLDGSQEPLHMTFSMVCIQVDEENVVANYVKVEEKDSLNEAWSECIKKINNKEYAD